MEQYTLKNSSSMGRKVWKIIKYLLITLLSLIIVALIVALFVPKKLQFEREVVVNKSKQKVYDYIKQLKNQNEYGVWSKMDSAMKQEYIGLDGTVGFKSSWEGNKDVGKGSQTITKIIEGERMEVHLMFEKPMKSEMDAWFTVAAKDSTSTLLKWGMRGETPYPFNVFNIFGSMEKMLAKDLDAGLKSAKEIMEKKL